ncbi:hypothetical protein ACLBSV_29545 [Klebsiella pneumoniae]
MMVAKAEADERNQV